MIVSTPAAKAESVYWTHDEKDNPVVAWTEATGSTLELHFATSFDNGGSFTRRKKLSLSGDVATHAEGMPKIAFKKDGTIIAAYERKSPTKDNKYAGTICYVVSADNGRSWTKEALLHSDTLPGRSRSYFDMERLADGQIGASWLDIKLDNATGGRSVRFSRTTERKGFGQEIIVDSSACQCCRLDVYTDIAGQVNVAYRGVENGSMGRQVRDMMIATSGDDGKSFKTPLKISQDNWVIDGCPHTGPSLCSNQRGLYSMWYTEGNGTGIYYSVKETTGDQFTTRTQVSARGRHPQMSADGARFIMVWEENSDADDTRPTKIMYEINDGGNRTRTCLNPGRSNAYLPVVTHAKNCFLIAFLMETDDGVGMFTTRVIP